MADGFRGPGSLTRTMRAGTTTITQYCAVKQGTDDDECLISASANDDLLGIALNTQAVAHGPVEVLYFGETFAIAGAAIAAGVSCQSNGDGNIKTATASGYPSMRALEHASASGDMIKVLVNCMGGSVT